MDVRVDVAEGRLQIPVAVSAEQADAVAFNDRTDVFLTALREDVSVTLAVAARPDGCGKYRGTHRRGAGRRERAHLGAYVRDSVGRNRFAGAGRAGGHTPPVAK